MSERVERSGLQVDAALAGFIEGEVLAPLGRDAAAFWAGFADLVRRFAPRNLALLDKRDELQAQIDRWHGEQRGQPHDPPAYRAFLERIGYLVPEPAPFEIGTRNVDVEIGAMAGPQLVVPALNARFVLNAANARWGSLYDAYYGTDALPDAPAATGPGYDARRGAAVIEAARAFLDLAVPLDTMSWSEIGGPGDLALCDPDQLLGRTVKGFVFCNNGLHVEVVFDREHPVGRDDRAGIADVRLEAALTTIVDLEDSIAAVDAADKLAAYRNWLGVLRGDLEARFDKAGRAMTRRLEPDLAITCGDGGEIALAGRSLLFVRTVGHLMTTPAILQPGNAEIPEGILDAVVTGAIGALDVAGLTRRRNSRCGSIYVVKPKMHGPEECAFTNDLFDAVEDLLGLERHTIKVGVMDEERRTSANLAACIHAVKDRIAFINTGFLDRTGDEIHTSMRAGPMIRKGAMKASTWLEAYEKRNVAIGLACGLSGKAQIGKGMWAAPERMHAMLEEKEAHLLAGANTAWVPSPTAAVLHALHYHAVDVFDVQPRLGDPPGLDALLTIPLADARWSDAEIAAELDTNCQSLLGYVVRWIGQGIGCSKVPDLGDVGLMEDRATLRISSQHLANWLLHGVASAEQVVDSLKRMAARVDAQNAGDPAYRPMAGRWDSHPAFLAARDLVFEGLAQPNGYTEPLLHAWRLQVKGGG
ncbi:MAG TPA: malate synthase G [Croceibacterium sp.]|nr:malate synthase G [Croceibacterium sp.]